MILSKYATNRKTTISQRSLSNLGLLLFLIFNWYNWFRFSINTSGWVPHRFYRNQTTELISTLDHRFRVSIRKTFAEQNAKFFFLCASVLREKTTICAIIRKSHFNCPFPLSFYSSNEHFFAHLFLNVFVWTNLEILAKLWKF